MKCLWRWLALVILVYLTFQAIIDWDSHDAVVGDYPTKGMASWYRGSLTASGERIDTDSLTCAMRKKDYGKHYQVCSVDSGSCVVVKHNDFGPRKRLFRQGRIIDLSHAAFSRIAKHKTGLVDVVLVQVNTP